MAELLKADLDELMHLQYTMETSANSIKGIEIDTAAESLVQALPGSGLDVVCGQAVRFVSGAYADVADKISKVADSIKQARQTLHETDQNFADAMKKFDVHHAGGN